VCWLQGIGGVGRHSSVARNGRWDTGYGWGSGMGMTGSGAGTLGGKDSFGSTEGNIRVEDGLGLAWGITESGKATEGDEDDENFRG